MDKIDKKSMGSKRWQPLSGSEAGSEGQRCQSSGVSKRNYESSAVENQVTFLLKGDCIPLPAIRKKAFQIVDRFFESVPG